MGNIQETHHKTNRNDEEFSFFITKFQFALFIFFNSKIEKYNPEEFEYYDLFKNK